MPARHLNDQLIKAGLICPPDKHQIEFTDADRTGLYIEVRATSPGQGTFWWRFKHPDTGKTARVKIGRTTDVSVKEAKEKTKTLRARLQLKDDITSQKRKNKITWNEFFEQEWKPYALAHKRSAKGDISMQRQIAPTLGMLPLEKITRKHFQDFHLGIRNSGRSGSTADHFGRLMRRVMNHAVDIGVMKSNPLSKIKLFHEDNRKERYLSHDEFARLIKVLKEDKNQSVCRIIMFLICTGCRRGEAISAKWSCIDAERRLWRIPQESSKSKKNKSIPLGNAAIDLIQSLPRSTKHDYLFFSERTGMPYQCIKTVWNRLCKSANLPDDISLHSLRHTYASMLINEGRTLYEVSKLLSHSSIQVTERYAHLAPSTLQSAANSASDVINAAIKAVYCE